MGASDRASGHKPRRRNSRGSPHRHADLQVPGRDLSKLDAVARHLQAKEAGEVSTWSDNVPRFTGYSTAHRAPWLVSVGFPMEVASAGITTRLVRSLLYSLAAIAVASTIAWMLS